MAHTLDKVNTFTPPVIPEFKGTLKVTLVNGQILTLVSSGSPALNISEIFDPDANKQVDLTITITGRETDV